jgi:hypothetical protein
MCVCFRTCTCVCGKGRHAHEQKSELVVLGDYLCSKSTVSWTHTPNSFYIQNTIHIGQAI